MLLADLVRVAPLHYVVTLSYVNAEQQGTDGKVLNGFDVVCCVNHSCYIIRASVTKSLTHDKSEISNISSSK